MAAIVPGNGSLILSDPGRILETARGYFPMAEGSIDKDQEGRVWFCLKLQPDSHPVKISHGIDRKMFENKLSDLALKFKNAQIKHVLIGSKLIKPQLSPEHFLVLGCELQNFHRFQRILYRQQKRKSCEDAICDFLKNPEDENLRRELFLMGFGPGCELSKDQEYFDRIYQVIAQLPEGEPRAQMVQAFMRFYPAQAEEVMQSVATSAREAELAQSCGALDFYQACYERIMCRIIGQPQAVKCLARALATQKEGEEKHMCFLFVGPTGVGKTELAKAVASEKINGLIRFDMNHYEDEYDCSKLFGSSSGFVGSTSKPHIAEALDRSKPSIKNVDGNKTTYEISDVVILLDELEKAHQKVKQSLLNVIAEGRVVCSYTERIEPGKERNVTLEYLLTKSIVIGTSNLFQRQIVECFQQGMPFEKIAEEFTSINNKTTDREEPLRFTREFLGRLKRLPFGPIDNGARSYQKIINIQFGKFARDCCKVFKLKSVRLSPLNRANVLGAIEDRLYGEGVDIRRVERFFNDVKGLVVQQKVSWGPFHNKCVEITLDPSGNLVIRLFFYDAIFDQYIALPEVQDVKI